MILYTTHYKQVLIDIMRELLVMRGHSRDYQRVIEYASCTLSLEPGIQDAYYWIFNAAEVACLLRQARNLTFPDTEDTDTEETVLEIETMEKGKDKLLYMGQASIRITTAEGKVIYIDPYVGSGYEPAADLILVTHSHYDHNGVDKISNRNPDCRIITWKEALDGGNHQTFDLGFATVEAVEAGYNRWHSVKECVGYVVTLSDGISIYVTGDTSKTEQMPEPAEKHIDYAFYCCDGIFNMDLDEAAECARLVGAQYDVPYHVLAQDGTYFDRDRAEQFESPNSLIIDEGEEIELTKE